MRVVAGELRGRRIESPTSEATRPTTDKVREAIFNALNSLGVVFASNVVDLFAGTGALGIEALSRGAARCTFVENDRAALAVLRRNIDSLGLTERAAVVSSSALTVPIADDVDLVLADPPYGFSDWEALLQRIPCGLVVTESAKEVPAPEGWEVLRAKKYGRSAVTFLQRVSVGHGTVTGT